MSAGPGNGGRQPLQAEAQGFRVAGEDQRDVRSHHQRRNQDRVLAGAFLSSFVRRRLPARGVLLLELWTWTGCSLFLVWPNVYVLTASIVPTALVIPSTDSVVHSYRYALTPDRLQGRVTSVWATIGLAIAPLGPLVAGILLDSSSARATIAVFAAFGLVLALWGTLSPSIRTAPSLDDLAELPAPAH